MRLVRDGGAIAGAQARRRGLVHGEPSVADERHARNQAVGEIEIVGCQHDDGAVCRQMLEKQKDIDAVMSAGRANSAA